MTQIKISNLTSQPSAFELKRVRRNFILAGSIFAVGLFVSSLTLFISTQIRSHSFVFETDKLIPTSFISSQIRADWSTPVIRTTIADFVKKLRTIPNDAAVMSDDLAFVLSHVLKDSPAHQRVSEFINHRSQGPDVLIKQYTRRVTVRSVNFIGGNTWLAEWDEVAFPKSDTTNRRSVLYRGEFEITPGDAPDVDSISRNPLGITIRNFTQSAIGQRGN